MSTSANIHPVAIANPEEFERNIAQWEREQAERAKPEPLKIQTAIRQAIGEGDNSHPTCTAIAARMQAHGYDAIFPETFVEFGELCGNRHPEMREKVVEGALAKFGEKYTDKHFFSSVVDRNIGDKKKESSPMSRLLKRIGRVYLLAETLKDADLMLEVKEVFGKLFTDQSLEIPHYLRIVEGEKGVEGETVEEKIATVKNLGYIFFVGRTNTREKDGHFLFDLQFKNPMGLVKTIRDVIDPRTADDRAKEKAVNDAGRFERQQARLKNRPVGRSESKPQGNGGKKGGKKGEKK